MAEDLYVLLGDVVRSREAPNREGLRSKLEEACENLNRMHRDHLRAEFGILKGVDEIGAVLGSVAEISRIVSYLEESISPTTIRVVVVHGGVDTAVSTRDIARMDGAGFHAAAALMEDLKSKGLLFSMAVGDSILDGAIVSAVNAIEMLKGSWTKRNREVAREYELEGSQARAGIRLGVSQQAVSAALQKIGYSRTRLVEDGIREAMAGYARRLAEEDGRDE